jgi:hypothetical protein
VAKLRDAGRTAEAVTVDVADETSCRAMVATAKRIVRVTRIEVSKVSLGSYEACAGEIIFGAKPLASLPDYQLLVGRYLRTGKFNPAGNFTYPARMTRGLNGWYFALNGFRILAKLDTAPLPAEIGPAIVNGNDRLIGSFMNYESTTEGQSVRAMAREAFVRDHTIAPQ